MSGLENYIQNLKEYFKNNSDLTETEKVMYVYLDLGKKFKFDQNFYFAGSKERKRIYDHSNFQDYLEESFDRNTIICKSSARICKHIFTSLGIKCIAIDDENDLRKYKHVYNVIIPKDGSESYSIDLQDDIQNIEFHDFTENFGLSLYDGKSFVIPRKEQKRIHEKLGYISKDNPYMDEYIYLFKQDLGYFDTFNEKIDFVLKNIDPAELDGINYWERRWKHNKFLAKIFGTEELDKKLHEIELYKEQEGQKNFYNSYFVMNKTDPEIYIYSNEDYRYNKFSLKELAKMIKNDGFKLRRTQGVPGLKKEMNRLDDEIQK